MLTDKLSKSVFFHRWANCIYCICSGFLILMTETLGAYTLLLEKIKKTPGENIRLQDVAQVRDTKNTRDSSYDSSIEKQIAKRIFLKELKSPRYFTALDIRNFLRREKKMLPTYIYGVGTWLIPQNRQFTSLDLQKLFYQQIRRLAVQNDGYARQIKDLEFHITEGAKISLPEKNVVLQYYLPKHSSRLRLGERIIPLDLFYILPQKDSTHKRRELLRFQIPIQIRKKVLLAVAQRPLKIGEHLQAGDFRWQERSIDDSTIRYTKSNLLKRRVMRPIKKGEILTEGNVQRIPTVFRGQRLQISYQKNALVLRCYSIAIASGYVGDSIPVRLIFSKTAPTVLRQARIISENTVELLPTLEKETKIK